MMYLLLTVLLVSTLMTDSYGCQLYEDKVYGGTFADCSRRNISRIPDDLPANTTSLDLSRNIFSVFNEPQTILLKSLKYLNLSYNGLKSLKNDSFQSLEGLQELYLHNNKLTYTSFPDDVFQPLKNLSTLHLHNNDQNETGSYPEDAFAKLRALEELKTDTFRETTFGYSFSHMLSLKHFVLGFVGCKLEHIQNKTFERFRNISVISLDLNYCPLYKVDIGAFLSLRHLKNLFMSNTDNLVPTEAVLAMYGFRYRTLSSIKMNNIFAVNNFRNEKLTSRILSNDVMVYLKDVCVEEFSMINNQILWIGTDLFNNSTLSYCIKYLDVSMNDLYGDSSYFFLLSLFPNLVYFNMSSHAQDRRGSVIHNNKLSVSKAVIEITLPKTLQILNVNGFTLNDATMVCNISVYNATSLKNLSFANVGFNNIKYRLTGLESLTSLDISHNNCSVMNPNFYNDFPNLVSLSMANVNFESNFLLNYGRQLFHPMKELKKVNIYSNNIRLLDVNIFSTNKIEEVVLSHNRFETVPFDLKTTPNLQHLDLSFNSLAVLSDNEMNSLDDLAVRHNVTVNLKGNLLSCVCQNLEFILWLHSTNVKMNQGSTYICQMSNGSITNTSYIRDHYEEIWLSCNSEILLSVTVATFSMLLLAIAVMYLTMRHKTFIINIILRMFGYGSLPQTQGRVDFLNDAYIGYCDADYQYICHTARDHLENKRGLKVFIRDRDTMPGDEIADDIINGIDTSWKTVLYVTATFQNDRWCRFIINRCVYSSARRPHGSVILVLSDDVRRGDIDPALLNVVEERNIFYVERYRGHEDRLWRDVAKVVKQDCMA